eukprot:GHVU01172769.1.p1 GENE.GHVU01172769.1~~GHVU01172769.1.p1  ORF type:complete len:122 (+),score=28.73 GHVU01172769.1:177-542(+)
MKSDGKSNGNEEVVREISGAMGQQYVIMEDGKLVIPGTRRADGTLRKEIRVKQIPMEERGAFRSSRVVKEEQQEKRGPIGYSPPGELPPASPDAAAEGGDALGGKKRRGRRGKVGSSIVSE